jgi:F-type H+-transporting ATPase subunit delta
MSNFKVSIRYATSLLELAAEKNNLDRISQDMELVCHTIETNNQLKLVLASPIIKSPVKLSILTDIFKPVVCDDSLKFLLFVVEKNREEVLFEIIKKFLELKDVSLGIVNVDVTTAVEFTAAQTDELRKKMESYLNKKTRLKFKIDRQIIGGFVAKVGDSVFDASLKHQLDLLKKQFIKGGASLN